MKSLNLDRINFHERLVFVWIATGLHGEAQAAFYIDGRDSASPDQARIAVREALERADERIQIARIVPGTFRTSEAELADWRTWAEFRQFLNVYGPVYPWDKPVPLRVHPPIGPQSDVPLPSLYDGVHFETWGQLIKIYPDMEGPIDPVLGGRAEAYALNSYTGEMEANTRLALLVARHVDNEGETWPLSNEDEFISRAERKRENLLRKSIYHRQDKPEIFAAYEQAARDGTTEQTRRATYEMWRQHQRRRAFFLINAEPVRIDLADDGTPTMAWRLDTATGRITPTNQADAEAVLAGTGTRVTEDTWTLTIEEIRRTLDVDGEIAEVYAKVAAQEKDQSLRAYLFKSFRLWAEKFAEG
ncbi:hypothetical protein [Actinokineospora globicatena]|uniref:Uncharacterized protein n=1 Tax=Actinokineospora globicatena TaxID=103729 RepID=A0A9W6QH14_9PSEU|nr:hypothetical protein [Actinokineospora globicatena]GLW89610.1 hypothetical protein Aglo03_04260 [Actinokineospora globicatena]